MSVPGRMPETSNINTPVSCQCQAECLKPQHEYRSIMSMPGKIPETLAQTHQHHVNTRWNAWNLNMNTAASYQCQIVEYLKPWHKHTSIMPIPGGMPETLTLIQEPGKNQNLGTNTAARWNTSNLSTNTPASCMSLPGSTPETLA